MAMGNMVDREKKCMVESLVLIVIVRISFHAAQKLWRLIFITPNFVLLFYYIFMCCAQCKVVFNIPLLWIYSDNFEIFQTFV